MKYLILSCGTGQGHNSAARAIQEAATLMGHTCVIADANEIRAPFVKKTVDGVYNQTINIAPSVFGACYYIAQLSDLSPLPDMSYNLNRLDTHGLVRFIKEENFDAVICTHLFPLESMTNLRRKGKLNVPLFGVYTDYTTYPFIGGTEPDVLFISCKEQFLSTVGTGIDPSTICVSGIPTAKKFRDCVTREEARQELGLPENKKIVLLMSGGTGSGFIDDVCDYYHRMDDDSILVLALCGRNQKLYDKIAHRYADERIRPVSFTDKVNLYMAASDVLVSKPGGLSTTEAAVVGIPLVHLLAMYGCESDNAAYFSKTGMSYLASSPKDAAEYSHKLAFNEEKKAAMLRAQREHIRRDTAPFIVEKVTSYVEAHR